jgi:hypothetical protein
MSDIQAQEHSESCERISAVTVTAGVNLRVIDIDKMRSDFLELLDEYDAIALVLHRMHIPLKKSWEAYQAVATARLKEMVELHDRARAAQLSMELGESKFSEAQIRRLDTEVQSLADSLSSGMETLRTSISAMQSAADTTVPARVSPCVSGDTPVRPRIPAALLHPVSAHSAESAPDSAAPPAPQAERDARRRSRPRADRQTEMIANEKLRTEVNEWIRGNAAAHGHSDADCTAKEADYSDWRPSLRLTAELFPVIEHLQVKNVAFVAWSIRHMATKGKLQPMINGTRNMGGYSKSILLEEYKTQNPGDPEISISVFNNKRVPPLGTLWTIAQELVTNTQKHLAVEVDVNAPLPGAWAPWAPHCAAAKAGTAGMEFGFCERGLGTCRI